MNFKSKKNKVFFTVILILLASLWLASKGHEILGFGMVTILSIYMIWPIKNDLISIAKNSFVIKFFNIIIWFISYIVSTKMISYFMDIREEYLKFSPAVVAIPISIMFVFSFVFIFCLIGMTITSAYKQPSVLIPSKIKEKIENSHGMMFLERMPFLLILLILPFSLVGATTPFVLKLSLLTDASFVSDCGVRSAKTVYIRKNSKECYVIKLDTSVMSDKPTVIQKDKE